MTREEQIALHLMDPEGIQREIEDRRKLMGEMVGTLYPSIIAGEIAQLQQVYIEKTIAEKRG